MKFAIVGANGQVGTELCFLLRNEDLEVVPIVRNKLAAGFLDYHGFDCRIADISDEEDAREALNDIDVIVVAALASGLQARRINRLLIQLRSSSRRLTLESFILALSELSQAPSMKTRRVSGFRHPMTKKRDASKNSYLG